MIQSTLHIALIMDGNGRWAAARGLPRPAGHRAGERALRRVVEAAPSLGVTTLTAYAFSSDNWKRPAPEVAALMVLLQTHMARAVNMAKQHGWRLSVIGRRDRLATSVLEAIEFAEAETRLGSNLHVRLAIDYSSRDALIGAFRKSQREIDRETVSETLGSKDVDLLIRTGGEQRLSDFLLWECAYAELLFTPCLWPDFGPDQLREALNEFHKRNRRFGGLGPQPGGAVSITPAVVESRG